MNQFSARYGILTVLFLAIACVAFFVYTTFNNTRQTTMLGAKINKVIETIAQTDKIEKNLDQLEFSLHGYFFDDSMRYEPTYRLALATYASDTLRLNQTTPSENLTAAQAQQLKQLIGYRLQLCALTENIFKTQGAHEVTEFNKRGAAKKIFDSTRLVVNEVVLQNKKILESANHNLHQTAQKTTNLFILMATGFCLLLIWLFYFINADLKRRQQSAAQLLFQASLLQAISEAIITTDEKLIITGWNSFAEKLYGYTAQEAIGQIIGELLQLQINQDELESSFSDLKKLGHYRDEYMAYKKNKEVVYLMASVNTIKSQAGEITGYIAIHKDITDRVLLDQQLQKINQQLEQQVEEKTAEIQNMVERISDVFIAVDNDWNFTYVNSKTAELLKTPAGILIGRNVWNLFPHYKSKRLHSIAEEAKAKQEYRFFEVYIDFLDHWADTHIYPSPTGLSIYFQDTTEKKRAEAEVRQSERKLQKTLSTIQLLAQLSKDLSQANSLTQINEISILAMQQASGSSAIMLQLFDEKNHLKIVSSKNCANQLLTTFETFDGWQTCLPQSYIVAEVGEPLTQDLHLTMQASGFNALRFIPICSPDTTLGCFILFYANNQNDQTATKELTETIARDVAFAIKEKQSALDVITSRKKYKLLFDFNPMPMWMIALPNEQFIDVNDAAIKAYGFSKAEFLEMNSHQIFEQPLVTTSSNHATNEQVQICKCRKKNGVTNRVELFSHHMEYDGLQVRLVLANEIEQKLLAEESLQQSYVEIRQLATHLQNIREEERAHIAREIHDELGQQLTGLKMYVSWLYKKSQPVNSDLEEKFIATINLVEDTIRSVRKISTELRPSMLDDLGLVAALEWQSAEFEKRFGINTEFSSSITHIPIPDQYKTGLFRIFQESLTNVARHSGATRVVCTFAQSDNHILLSISDNGNGFSPQEKESNKTFGLFGMKERTLAMGGDFEIKSLPGAGTSILITVPLFT